MLCYVTLRYVMLHNVVYCIIQFLCYFILSYYILIGQEIMKTFVADFKKINSSVHMSNNTFTKFKESIL